VDSVQGMKGQGACSGDTATCALYLVSWTSKVIGGG
jgi:hypothetical protein